MNLLPPSPPKRGRGRKKPPPLLIASNRYLRPRKGLRQRSCRNPRFRLHFHDLSVNSRRSAGVIGRVDFQFQRRPGLTPFAAPWLVLACAHKRRKRAVAQNGTLWHTRRKKRRAGHQFMLVSTNLDTSNFEINVPKCPRLSVRKKNGPDHRS